MKRSIITIGVILLMFFVSCEKNYLNNTEILYKQNEKKVTINEGIYGTVTHREGNCMPQIGKSSCKEIPVKRTVEIYEEITIHREEPVIGNWDLQLFKTVVSDENGFFQVELPSGKSYAVFVVGEEGNSYGGSYWGHSTTVESGKIYEINVCIDNAVYWCFGVGEKTLSKG